MNRREVKSAPVLRFKGFTNDWEQRKLGKIVKIIGGGTPSTSNSNYWNGDINWYSPTEIGKKNFIFTSKKKITKLGLQHSSAKILPGKQTILFTSRAGIGDMAIMQTDGCTNQGFQSWVIENNSVNIYFLYSLGKNIKKEAIRKASGSTFLEISNKEVKKIPLFIPSKHEQDKLGKLLLVLDNLLSLQQRKLKLLKLLKQGMLQNLFTSKDTPILRFYGFYDILKQYKLSHLFYVNGRIGFRGYTRKDIISKNEGGIWAISPINIQDNCLVSLHNNTYITKAKYEESPEIQLRPSYSLLVKTGSTLGKSAYINNLYEPATINPQIAVLKPINKKISKYLGYILTTDNFLQQITALKIGGAIPTLTERDLKEVKLYIVPDTKEANKISNFLNKLDVIIGFQQKNINNLHQVKKFLFQNMFI